MSADHRDIRHRLERDPNRPGCSAPKASRKNPRTGNSTVDLDHPMDSKTRSERRLVEEDHASQRCEIDLSRSSSGTDLVVVAAKGGPDEEREATSVQSPGKATFELEEESVEDPRPMEDSKAVSVKRSKPDPRKAGKSREADLGVEDESGGEPVPKKTGPLISERLGSGKW